MFISNAYAQAAGAAPSGDMSGMFVQFLPIVLIFVIFYFLLLRPQQQRQKQHAEMISALKKGDMIVTTSGMIGKIKSVADDEVRVEFGPNVEVRMMRGAIGEVRSKSEPAPANDSKPASAG